MADDKFLEEEEKGSNKKKGGPKAGAKAKPMAAGAEGAGLSENASEPTISLFLAVGLCVACLVVGLIGGYLLAPRGAGTDIGGTPANGGAPALTPDQLNSRQLPASHPAVPGLNTETSGAAGGTSTSAPEKSGTEKTTKP